MTVHESFDAQVGRIAGGIYGDLSALFPHPPLMLVPPLTYKVRKMLEESGDLATLSDEGRRLLADKIRVSVIPLLFSLEIDPKIIERAAPMIELAAFRALLSAPTA